MGLRASNSWNTSVWPESIRLGMRQVVTATKSVTVMEYYFYLRAGTSTSHTERWRALSSRYSLLLGCWPFGFLIPLILKTSVWHAKNTFLDDSAGVCFGHLNIGTVVLGVDGTQVCSHDFIASVGLEAV